MSRDDAAGEFVAALNPYFSAPIAQALLTTTLRRVNLVPPKVAPASIPVVVAALERMLPAYITDATRRGECISRLRRLLALAEAAPVSQPAPSAPRAPAPVSTVIRIRAHDDVLHASEVGRDIARRIGFSHVDQTKIATVASELARNILVYAGTGELRITSVDIPRRGIEIVANDEGPGIDDVLLVMSNSYRSRTGMGMGLKGTKRLMEVFEITSARGKGTNVITRKFVP